MNLSKAGSTFSFQEGVLDIMQNYIKSEIISEVDGLRSPPTNKQFCDYQKSEKYQKNIVPRSSAADFKRMAATCSVKGLEAQFLSSRCNSLQTFLS